MGLGSLCSFEFGVKGSERIESQWYSGLTLVMAGQTGHNFISICDQGNAMVPLTGMGLSTMPGTCSLQRWNIFGDSLLPLEAKSHHP